MAKFRASQTTKDAIVDRELASLSAAELRRMPDGRGVYDRLLAAWVTTHTKRLRITTDALLLGVERGGRTLAGVECLQRASTLDRVLGTDQRLGISELPRHTKW